MFNRIFALVLLAVGFSTAARADYIPATWTDTLNVGSGIHISSGDSYTYTHNLNDNGFRPLTDWITDFHLSINLADDSRNWLDGPELAFVDLPGVLGDDYVAHFGMSGEEFGGWSVLGLLELNVLGTLTVTISSIIGDFNLVGSTLTATGRSGPAGCRPDGHGLQHAPPKVRITDPPRVPARIKPR
jgi:hypothetical protein